MEYILKCKNNKNGITLIALVITIIVLLILAGVSIAMLTGENGILTQANSAKEKTTKTEEEEKVKLAVMGSSINNDGFVEIIDETSFKQELANQFGNQELDVVVNGDGSFIVTVKDTKRKYYVNDDKTVINSDNIIEIGTAEELASFRDDVNAGNSYEEKVILLTSDITLNGNWIPIGTYSEETSDDHYLDVQENKPFKGIFDGCKHTINNLQIESTKGYQGLFGLVIDGTIRDITIAEDSSVTAGGISGVIVGCIYGFSGNISNCINNANGTVLGGIVGALIGQHTILNCKNYGDITGAGGIVGSSNGVVDWPEEFMNYSHKIINCGNYGSITRSVNNCGGIVGYFKGDIINCCNKADINATGLYVSGIVGGLDGRTENCYSIGDISGQNCVGGIVGAVGNDQGTYIYNCYSIGNVIGNFSVDEIVGNIYNSNGNNMLLGYGNCYNKNNTFTASDLGNAFVENPENANQPLLYWE